MFNDVYKSNLISKGKIQWQVKKNDIFLKIQLFPNNTEAIVFNKRWLLFVHFDVYLCRQDDKQAGNQDLSCKDSGYI